MMVRDNLADTSLVDSRNDLQRIHSNKVLTPYKEMRNSRMSQNSSRPNIDIQHDQSKTLYNDSLIRYCNKAQNSSLL